MKAGSKIARNAVVVGASTLLSRVLGLVRDMVMTAVYGAGMVADAFYVAFAIPNLLRRLVGEGALTVAFISVFTKLREEQGEAEAKKLAATFWLLMTLILAGMTALGMVFAREIVTLFTNPEFRSDPVQFELAVDMTRELFPYLFMIGLVALSMGILNSYQRFFAPAFAPVMLNLAWISAIVLLSGPLLESGIAAMIGVLVGGALQLALQVPFLFKVAGRTWPGLNFRHPALKRIGLLMLPSALAVGVVQINTLIATYFVTEFPGARAQLYYSNRLTEFPYAIFTLAIATAVLPVLSEQAGRGDRRALLDTLAYGLKMATFIVIPAAVGLALIGTPLIQVIFERGSFTAADTSETALMLIMACVGMWAVAALRILVQAYYAVEDMVTPLVAGAVSLLANGLLCWLLAAQIGRAGVPLAISLAAVANLLALVARLPARVGALGLRDQLRTAILTLLATIPMAGLILALNRLPVWERPGELWLKVPMLALAVGGGALLFALAAYILRVSELNMMLEILKKRLRRKNADTPPTQ